MSDYNILNKVKTANGYDVLFPLTPYQIHSATSVTGNGSVYNVSIPLPDDYFYVPLYIRFVANANASSNCSISVNGLTSVAIRGNIGNIKSGDSCLVCYDNTNSKCYLITIENKTEIQQSQVGGTTVFNDGNIVETLSNGTVITTTFNQDGSIVETIVQDGITVTKTTTFNSDGSITEVVS